jgi:hypothetical protein
MAAKMYDLSPFELEGTKAFRRHKLFQGQRREGRALRRSIAQVRSLDDDCKGGSSQEKGKA